MGSDMIPKICFTADWLEKKRKELGNVDQQLEIKSQ